MGRARTVVLTGCSLLLGALLLVGCSSNSTSNAGGSLSPATATDSITSAVVSPPSSSSAVTAPTSTASALPTAATSAISIPPDLCQATDVPQNAADAFMGALSAGDQKQATACVLPNTVPAATIRSLLVAQAGTATYLPRDGVDGPSVFGYQGNGKSIDVTVTKRSDGKFWITKVAVGNA